MRRTAVDADRASASARKDAAGAVASASAPAARIAGVDFAAPSDEVAKALIGCVLRIDGVGGRIVETEAYDRDDPASHSFAGRTPRNAVMFGPPAHLYVYRSYGIHWCLNITCREDGHGAAVLIRAIEPLSGLDAMRERRGLAEERLLCAGPGRLGQALDVTHTMNGLALADPRVELLPPDVDMPIALLSGPRIGISKAMDVPWRYGLAGSRFLSRRF